MSKVPYLSYDQIHSQAENFLTKFHPARELPIPIEKIIDVDMGINIKPHLGLLDEIGQDGFISTDLTTITVDEYVYDYIEVRYRFTLAHELAHAFLHRSIYESHSTKTIGDWKDFQKELPEQERKWLERQANCWAGLVLVPREELDLHTAECIKMIDQTDISIPENWNAIWERVSSYMGKNLFNVSADTVKFRIDYDKIKERYSD